MLKTPTDLILDDSWPSRSPATMPRDAKAWKLKRLLSHNEEPFVLYRDFVLLLLCYIVLSYVIVGLRVHGCACAVSEN